MLRACLAILAGVALAGCATSGDSEEDGLHLVHPSAEPTGLDGIVEGVVELDASTGCSWLEVGDGERLTIIWPTGTKASNDLRDIHLPDDEVVRPGDWVSGGGGHVPADFGAWGDIPETCPSEDGVAMFNSTADVSAGTE